MSWVGVLILLLGLGLLVAFLRGLMEFLSGLYQDYVVDPRERRRARQATLAKKAADAHPAVDAKTPHRPPGADPHPHRPAKPSRSTTTPPECRKTGPLGKLLKGVRLAVVHKGYDYWIAAALSESDLELKAKYLAKALALNPSYFPAWGLHGNALVDLKRYAEALECFERSLAMRPSSLAWYKKGMCCHHLGRPEEAVACLDRAIQTCADHEHKIREDAEQLKRTIESRLGTEGSGMRDRG